MGYIVVFVVVVVVGQNFAEGRLWGTLCVCGGEVILWLWLWLWLWVKISPTTKSEVVYYMLVERLYCGCGYSCGRGSKFR